MNCLKTNVPRFRLAILALYEVASAFYGGAWEDNQEAKNFYTGYF